MIENHTFEKEQGTPEQDKATQRIQSRILGG